MIQSNYLVGQIDQVKDLAISMMNNAGYYLCRILYSIEKKIPTLEQIRIIPKVLVILNCNSVKVVNLS